MIMYVHGYTLLVHYFKASMMLAVVAAILVFVVVSHLDQQHCVSPFTTVNFLRHFITFFRLNMSS